MTRTTRIRTRRVGTPIALALPALLAVGVPAAAAHRVIANTEWHELWHHLTTHDTLLALKLSLVVSFSALGLSLLFGVPLAWLLARVDFPGKTLVRSLVLLPMVLPPTVGGVALLLGFGRRGLIGPFLENTFGIVLTFHTSGAIVAAAFVAMPFLVISLEGTLAGLRPAYEETAASLGASPVRVFLTVTLPMVAPGLVAGSALTWARALGEFGATITFAGNLPGTTQTLPLEVYLLLQDSPEAATSVSLLLLVIAMAVLVGLRGRWAGVSARRGRRARTPGRGAGRRGRRATAGSGRSRPRSRPSRPRPGTCTPTSPASTSSPWTRRAAPPSPSSAPTAPARPPCCAPCSASPPRPRRPAPRRPRRQPAAAAPARCRLGARRTAPCSRT